MTLTRDGEQWSFDATGTGLSLASTTNPVTVSLGIGDDSGSRSFFFTVTNTPKKTVFKFPAGKKDDADGDGKTAKEGDCDDQDPTVFPGAPELCDGADNNCNGTADEGFDLGTPCTVGIGACTRNGIKVCAPDESGTVCNATPGPPTTEICGNGVDEDCNGSDLACGPPPSVAIHITAPEDGKKTAQPQIAVGGTVGPEAVEVQCNGQTAGLTGAGFGITFALNEGKNTILCVAKDAPGKVGQAFSFDGVDDYLLIPDSNLGGLFDSGKDFTITMWMNKIPNRSSPIPLNLQSNSSCNGGLEWIFYGAGAASTDYGFGITDVNTCASIAIARGAVVPHEQWILGSVVYENGNLFVYADGQVVTSHLAGNAGWIKPVPSKAGGLVIGTAAHAINSPGSVHHYTGLIDEIAVYDRALSASEIQSVFAAGSAGTCHRSVTLDFNSLPSAQGWTYVGDGTPEANVFSVSGGVLTMNTLGRGGSFPHYEFPGTIDSALPFTLSMRARVTGYEGETPDNVFGFGVFGCEGANSERFGVGLSQTRIMTVTPDLSANLDATQFHDYLVKGTPGGGYQVFVDNTLMLNGQSAPGGCPYLLWLGDGTGGPNARAEITRFSFTQP